MRLLQTWIYICMYNIYNVCDYTLIIYMKNYTHCATCTHVCHGAEKLLSREHDGTVWSEELRSRRHD